jgi:uncharacterized protein (TIGR02265 family)
MSGTALDESARPTYNVGRHEMPSPAVHAPSMERCFRHTDLEWRLRAVPGEAACRGAFLNMIDERAAALGVRDEYRRFFGVYRFSPLRFHPVKDYLTRLAILSQIAYGDEHIYDGVRTIHSASVDAWTHTAVGKLAMAMASPSLGSVLRIMQRGYATRATTNYGAIEILESTEQRHVVRFRDEYVWIEHAMAGAAAAMARLCRLDATVDAVLETPFQGLIVIDVQGEST